MTPTKKQVCVFVNRLIDVTHVSERFVAFLYFSTSDLFDLMITLMTKKHFLQSLMSSWDRRGCSIAHLRAVHVGGLCGVRWTDSGLDHNRCIPRAAWYAQAQAQGQAQEHRRVPDGRQAHECVALLTCRQIFPIDYWYLVMSTFSVHCSSYKRLIVQASCPSPSRWLPHSWAPSRSSVFSCFSRRVHWSSDQLRIIWEL